MKKICAVFALFCVMFLFAACGSDSKESVYNDTDTSDSTSDKTDSDTTDTNSDDADSQSDSTADTTPDNGDSADDSDSDKPDSDNPDTEPDNGDSADDADTSDSQPEHETGDTTSDTGDTQNPDTGNTDSSDTDTGDTTSDTGDTQNPDTGNTDTGDTGLLTLGNICTGQTLCYNTSNGSDCFQDAYYASLGKCTAQSFTVSSDVVVDNNTGLTWQRNVPETYKTTECASGTACTYSEAKKYCDNLSLNGLNNWRVPNPLEFLTIVDNSKYNPATNSNFTNMPTSDSDFLWTSKECGTNIARAFSPYYGGYSYEGESQDTTYKVICVSGNELTGATSSDFTISSDGDEIVIDNRTGLMWQKDYTAGTWQEALAYCQSLNKYGYGGYSEGWRLPNKNELASLLDPSKSSKPYSNFPDMPSDTFWSSSTSVGLTSYAWVVYFRNGVVGQGYIEFDGAQVRCVRN